MSNNLVVFDFDGTLTTRDSFMAFAQKSVGNTQLLRAVLRCVPYLTAWKFRLKAGGYAKEKLFAALYAGRPHKWMEKQGEFFASFIPEFERAEVVKALDEHISNGDEVYIVSASMPEWITPWATRHSIPASHVIGTLCDVNGNGIITGRFASPNCYGVQKVERLQQAVGNLTDFHIIVYGDSSGDKEIFAIANTKIKIKKR